MTTWTDIVAKADRGEPLTDAEIRTALGHSDAVLERALRLARHHGDDELLVMASEGRSIWRFVARLKGLRAHR